MSILSRLVAATVTLLLLTACSPLKVLGILSPSRHYASELDLHYGADARQRLDVYLPSPVPETAPLVVFFYGGSWTNGDKADYEFVAASLTEAGIVVVIPNYRLYPAVRFPAFVEDGADAVAWSLANISSYGVNPSSVYVMGHSAGAHIAAMLAMNGDYLASRDIETDALAGFIGLSGPYDFLPIEGGFLEEVFPPTSRSASQPINFVSPAAPPTLLIHGTGDTTVSIANSRGLAAALRERAVDVTLKTYEGVGHVRIMLGLAKPVDFLARTLEDSRAFILDTSTQ
jgi:acetyl esterase/lipase